MFDYMNSGWKTRDYSMDEEDAAQLAANSGARDAYGNPLGTRTRAAAGFDRFGFVPAQTVNSVVAPTLMKQAQDSDTTRFAAAAAARAAGAGIPAATPLNFDSPEALAKTQLSRVANVPGGTDWFMNRAFPSTADRSAYNEGKQAYFDKNGTLNGYALPKPIVTTDRSGLVTGAGKKVDGNDYLQTDILKDTRFQQLLATHPDHARALYTAVTGGDLDKDRESKLALQQAQDKFNTEQGGKTFGDMREDPVTGKLQKRTVRFDPINNVNVTSWDEPTDYEKENYYRNFKSSTGIDTPRDVAVRIQQQANSPERQAYLASRGTPVAPGVVKTAHPTVAAANNTPTNFQQQGAQDRAALGRIAGTASTNVIGWPLKTANNLLESMGSMGARVGNRFMGAIGYDHPIAPDNPHYYKDSQEAFDNAASFVPSWMGGRSY